MRFLEPVRKSWRPVVTGVGLLLVVASFYVTPAFTAGQVHRAAESGTAAAINSAQAKQNTAEEEQAIKNLDTTTKGVQQLLAFVAAVQASSKTSQASTEWYVHEFQAICAATPGCKQVPLPPGL